MSRRAPAGRMVTPSPGLEAIYTALGGSNTHCEVYPAAGGNYSCLSVDPYTDRMRHEDPNTYDVITCTRCVPTGATHPTAAAVVVAERLAALAEELADIARDLR